MASALIDASLIWSNSKWTDHSTQKSNTKTWYPGLNPTNCQKKSLLYWRWEST